MPRSRLRPIVLACLLLLCCSVAKSLTEITGFEAFREAPVCYPEERQLDEEERDEAYEHRMYFRDGGGDRGLLDMFRGNGSAAGPPAGKPLKSLNCFGLGDGFTRLIDLFLKKSENGTNALKVMFYARTRDAPRRLPMRHGEEFRLAGGFDIRRRTVFIVHGFLADADMSWIKSMERALLKWDDVNIFVVDWSDAGNTWNYLKAAANTRTVGDQIATFVGQLANAATEAGGPDPSSWGPLHLIGHSLGAHICGYAARELRLRGARWPVHRITGLDPAQPCFRYSDQSLRLDRSDARFVDVIHTNGRLLRKLGLGLPYPIGHVDFYPNGGSIQPGCIVKKSSFWKYLPLPFTKIKRTLCSHGRSQLYFIESVVTASEKNCTFWAHEWDMSYIGVDNVLSRKCNSRESRSCFEMGINAEKYSNRGTFFAITGSSAPFCNVDERAIKEVKHRMEHLKTE